EPGGNYLWHLTTGSKFDDLGLVRINLQTGESEQSITQFENSEFGPVYSPFSDMTYDADQGVFYLTSNPAEGDVVIVSVDATTGQRKLVSGASAGSGID